jgi:hypothetical protein
VGERALREGLPVTRTGAIAVAAALLAAAAARGDDDPAGLPGTATPAATPTARATSPDTETLGGELYAGGALASFHGVGMRLLDLRLGIGWRLGGQNVLGLTGTEVAALVTSRGQIGSTEHGLAVRGGRLGLGLRVRSGRLTFGLDADAVLLLVERASTSGDLTGTGWGAGAGLALDLFRAGSSALYVGIDGTLTKIGASDDPWTYGAGAGVGFRW